MAAMVGGGREGSWKYTNRIVKPQSTKNEESAWTTHVSKSSKLAKDVNAFSESDEKVPVALILISLFALKY